MAFDSAQLQNIFERELQQMAGVCLKTTEEKVNFNVS